MKLTINYNNCTDRNYEEELEYLLEMEWALPNSFYTKSELSEFTVRKYKLLSLIKKEEEYNRDCKEYDNSSK